MVEQLGKNFPEVAALLAEARDQLLAFASFPKPHRRQTRSNNPEARLNRKIRRRTDLVGILPARAAVVRLLAAILTERSEG